MTTKRCPTFKDLVPGAVFMVRPADLDGRPRSNTVNVLFDLTDHHPLCDLHYGELVVVVEPPTQYTTGPLSNPARWATITVVDSRGNVGSFDSWIEGEVVFELVRP